ncbi:MAG: beta-lactamase family protein [Idiomarina sp.]|nr:beta-lactamase family protein [Idiomarina sp.]
MFKHLIIFMTLILTSSVHAEEPFSFSALKSQLDERVPGILEENKAPGVALAFVQGDEIIGVTSYGFADVETRELITEETMFNVGSISKVVTVWGVMQLVDQGKVTLDNPINQYLKRWQIPESEYNTEAVTLRNVLSHTSGLSLGPYTGWDSEDYLPSIVESLNGNNSGAGPVELIHEPDTQWSYSGGGYSLVQLLIEDVSGMDFEDYMQENVLVPLGMTSSTFNVTATEIEKSAKPYDENAVETSMVYFAEQAAAGLQTTVTDLARFNLAVLRNDSGQYNGTKLLSEELINQMIEPAPNTDGRWSMSYVVDAENSSLGFAGFNRGWESLTRSVTDQNFGYVILMNSSIGSVSFELDELIMSFVREDTD